VDSARVSEGPGPGRVQAIRAYQLKPTGQKGTPV
jgi:hypothetical protein